MKYLCGRCIHTDVCLVPRSTGCVEECKYFKEMPSHLPKQTNEEYLRSCDTEQLAEFLCEVWYGIDEVINIMSEDGEINKKDAIALWLKQPHTEKE